MGFMDKFSKILGGDKSVQPETVKGPSATLRGQGIDPSDLKFSFNQDGSITVAGHTSNQFECDRICQVIEGMPNVSGVKNEMVIGAPEPVVEREPEVGTQEAEVAGDQVTEQEQENSGRTYTVESGDTLWAIAEKMYGSGGKYMKIFEANTTLLDSPDKIFPGQKLMIPDLEES